MAKKGTYGAYQQQPQISRGWGGEDQIARIAARNVERKREERQRQYKMIDEARDAITQAELSTAVNPAEYSGKMQQAVYTMLDAYKTDLDDAQQAANANPSFENTLKIKKLQANFQNNLSSIKGIGDTMKGMAANRGNFDEIKSIPAYNGLSKFINGLPEALDKIDPRTLMVDGQHISSIFSDMVDQSSLVAPIDDAGFIDTFTKSAIGKQTKKIYNNEITGIATEKLIANEYDEDRARELFSDVSKNTPEYDKIVDRINLGAFDVSDVDELEEYVDNYMDIDEDGNAYVTEDGVFNYIRDMYIKPELELLTKTERTIEDKSDKVTDADINRAAKLKKQQEQVLAVDDFILGGKGDVGFAGKDIRVGGREGTVHSALKQYNPATGESNYAVNIKYIDPEDKTVSVVESVELGDNPAQELATYLYGIDYRTIKDGMPAYAEEEKKMTMADRANSVQLTKEIGSENIQSLIKGVADSDKIIEMFEDPEVGMAENIPSITYDVVKSNMYDPYNVGEDKNIGLGEESNGDNIKYNLKVEADRKAFTDKITLMGLVEEQMKSQGVKPDIIKTELSNLMQQKYPEYDLDAVNKYITDQKLPSNEDKDMRYKASVLVGEGKSDKEVIEELKKSTGDKKPAPSGKIVEQDGVTYEWNGYEYIEQ